MHIEMYSFPPEKEGGMRGVSRDLQGVVSKGHGWQQVAQQVLPVVRNSPTMGQKVDRGGGSMAASYFKALTATGSGDSWTSHRVHCVIELCPVNQSYRLFYQSFRDVLKPV